MKDIIAFRYTADNNDTYNELALFSISLSHHVSLYPQELAIEIDAGATMDVADFIDDNHLEFCITSIEVEDENTDEK